MTAQLSALVLETKNLSQVTQHIVQNKKTLIVFDIDNTLALPPEELGSEDWFSFKIQNYELEGFPADIAFNKTLQLYNHIHSIIDLKKVQNAPQLINSLQKQNIPTIALTARNLVQGTIRQLANLGIHLATIRLPAQHLSLPTPNPKRPACYQSGIIFCNGNDKGSLLLHFLDTIAYKPERIIFVDDKLKNIESVKNAAQQRNIDFVGLRYSKFDKRSQKFDHCKASKQLKRFLQQHPISQGPTPDTCT